MPQGSEKSNRLPDNPPLLPSHTETSRTGPGLREESRFSWSLWKMFFPHLHQSLIKAGKQARYFQHSTHQACLDNGFDDNAALLSDEADASPYFLTCQAARQSFSSELLCGITPGGLTSAIMYNLELKVTLQNFVKPLGTVKR